MKNIIPLPTKATIEEAAALWLVKIDQGDLSDEQKQQLHTWVNQHPRHRDALTRMARLWGRMDSLHLLAQLFPLQADRAPKRTEVSHNAGNWLQRHPLTVFFGAAASISAVLALLIALNDPVLHATTPAPLLATTEPVELIYQTELGQQSQATLKDGSRITLNTQSKLRVRYSEKERSIYLVSGEALFEVAKNPNRPFVVYAGSGAVRAVGTAFSVQVDNKQEVRVAVSEGTVQVVANSAASGAAKNVHGASKQQTNSVTLKKGGTASYHETIETYAYIDQEKLEQKLAWKNGKWIFDGETLADVITEANRYSAVKIQIVDPAIADLRVGGYFNAGDIDALLATLEAGFNIKVKHSADSIQLSSLSTPPTSAQ